MIAWNHQHWDTDLAKFIKPTDDILMAQLLTVFRQVSRDQDCIIRPIPVQFPEVLQGTGEA